MFPLELVNTMGLTFFHPPVMTAPIYLDLPSLLETTWAEAKQTMAAINKYLS